MQIKILYLLGMSLLCFSANAQSTSGDTLKLTVRQAEDRFLKNNLQIIIQRFNIDNAQAQVITAKLFNNPDFSYSNGIYDDQPGALKEEAFNVSQLFTTAGKRNKNIRLAKIGVEQARFQFFDLLRTLKFTLRSDFYNIYFQQQSAKVYDQEINSLKKTFAAYQVQYPKGNVAEKELLRIQSQLYTLQAEYNSLQTGIDTLQSDVKILIRVGPGTVIDPQVSDDLYGKQVVLTTPYQRLADSANVNRYDLRLAKSTVEYNNVNLQLQKATAVPDISLSVNYDREGGYGTNYLGAGIDFSLPFFNRNQGGIKQARIAIDQSKVQLQSQQEQLASDLAVNYKIALRLEGLYNSFDPKFKQDFTHLIQEVYKNYEKRNISLLEFLDFYDSYKTNTLQLNTIEFNLVSSLEELNFVTGTPFFNQ